MDTMEKKKHNRMANQKSKSSIMGTNATRIQPYIK